MSVKTNQHKFSLVVETAGNRKQAERAVLLTFSMRKPDGCYFNLIKKSCNLDKKIRGWMMEHCKVGTGMPASFELVGGEEAWSSLKHLLQSHEKGN